MSSRKGAVAYDAPKRAERHAQAKTLRNEGLLLREIAERMGLAISTVGGLLTDPTGEKARERKRRYEHPCSDCGKTINSNGLRRGNGRCSTCTARWEKEQSRRWIIESFHEWEERFGVPPVASNWNMAHARLLGRVHLIGQYETTGRPWPSVTLVQNNFGSWNAAREAAGYETFAPGMYGRDGEDPAIIMETVALYRSGLSMDAVGERMGCSGTAVARRLRKAGEPSRAWDFTVINAAKTHCPQGHPYDEINTYRDPRGRGRQCRTCRSEHSRNYMRRKRAA